MAERNAGVALERRIEFRVGIHLGDVVEEADGDLMGDGVNIAARLEGICEPGAICLSEDAYRQVKGRLDLAVADLGPTQLKNIAEPIRVYSLQVGAPRRQGPRGQSDAPKRRSSLLRRSSLGFVGISRIGRGRHGISLPETKTVPRPSSRPRQRRPRPRISPSSCCPSRTSLAMRARTILPTASPRT